MIKFHGMVGSLIITNVEWTKAHVAYEPRLQHTKLINTRTQLGRKLCSSIVDAIISIDYFFVCQRMQEIIHFNWEI